MQQQPNATNNKKRNIDVKIFQSEHLVPSKIVMYIKNYNSIRNIIKKNTGETLLRKTKV